MGVPRSVSPRFLAADGERDGPGAATRGVSGDRAGQSNIPSVPGRKSGAAPPAPPPAPPVLVPSLPDPAGLPMPVVPATSSTAPLPTASASTRVPTPTSRARPAPPVAPPTPLVPALPEPHGAVLPMPVSQTAKQSRGLLLTSDVPAVQPKLPDSAQSLVTETCASAK